MRIWIVLTLCLFCGLLLCKPSFASDTLEIDLVDKHIRLVDFHFGDKAISADIDFQFQTQDDALVFAFEGRNVRFNNQDIGQLKAHLTKRGPVLFIDELRFLQYAVKGTLDLTKQEASLEVEARWREESEFLQGEIFVHAKVWGGFDKVVASGYLTVNDGVYEGQEFSRLRLDFLGRPPVLNITDSQIILYDGSEFEYVNAVLDLRNLSSPVIPHPEFVSQKVYFGEWQVFAEDRGQAGLRKQLDRKFDVFIGTSDASENDREMLEAGTELRYNWQGDQFLKLRMEEDKTILGFEQRREF